MTTGEENTAEGREHSQHSSKDHLPSDDSSLSTKSATTPSLLQLKTRGRRLSVAAAGVLPAAAKWVTTPEKHKIYVWKE